MRTDAEVAAAAERTADITLRLVAARREIDALHRRPNIAACLREFHETYGVPIRSVPIARPPEADLRWSLLAEEVQEYHEAVEVDDVVEVADALADIVYVAYGSALAHGIDLDAVLAEVHRSNMSKLGADGGPVLREDGKVVKGPGYFRPDVARVMTPKEQP